jgi:serine/threonine-protein kinase HipA
MSQMIKSVLSSIDIAKDKALKQGLSAVEVNHIELCIEIIKEAAEEINKEIEDLPSMKEFFE